MGSKRLFVTKEDVFTLSVFFTKEGEMKVAREKDIPKEDLEKWEKFDVEFSLPDYGTAKGIMRNSTEYERGQPVLNIGMFHNALLVSLARKWNLKDDEGKDLALDIQKLNELRPDITHLFVELLQDKLTKEGLYDSLLAS